MLSIGVTLSVFGSKRLVWLHKLNVYKRKHTQTYKLATAYSALISGKILNVNHGLVEGQEEGELMMSPKS